MVVYVFYLRTPSTIEAHQTDLRSNGRSPITQEMGGYHNQNCGQELGISYFLYVSTVIKRHQFSKQIQYIEPAFVQTVARALQPQIQAVLRFLAHDSSQRLLLSQ